MKTVCVDVVVILKTNNLGLGQIILVPSALLHCLLCYVWTLEQSIPLDSLFL